MRLIKMGVIYRVILIGEWNNEIVLLLLKSPNKKWIAFIITRMNMVIFFYIGNLKKGGN
jgi:hypothetical protein